MPRPDLTDDELDILINYSRRKFDGERWPFSVELWRDRLILRWRVAGLRWR